jgi:hypothetical protein
LWQNKVIETDYAQQLRDALGMICKTNMQWTKYDLQNKHAMNKVRFAKQICTSNIKHKLSMFINKTFQSCMEIPVPWRWTFSNQGDPQNYLKGKNSPFNVY